MPAVIATALALAFPALVLIGAFKDAVSFTIPNWISLALVGVFPVAAFAVGVPLPAIAWNLAVGVAVLAVGMGMFALRWIGGGDAKLMSAAALWLGWPAVLTFVVGAAIAGGVLAAVLILLRSAALRPIVLAGPRWVGRLAEPGEGVPYGVAIAAGALLAFAATPFGATLGL